MMTKSKFNNRTKLKILALIPALTLLFVFIACFNGLYGNSINNSKTGNFNSVNLSDTSKIIYIVDGVVTDNLDLVQKDSIESINVLKQDNVMIVRTKKYSTKLEEIKIRKRNRSDMSNTLVLLNGVKSTKKIEQIDPASIESMNVIKDPAQMKIYTKMNYNAVILITTKK
jgi:hypothetical protein